MYQHALGSLRCATIMCIDMMTFTGIGFDSDDLLGGASLLRLFMTKSKTLKKETISRQVKNKDPAVDLASCSGSG